MKRQASLPFDFCLRVFTIIVALIAFHQTGVSQQTTPANPNSSGRNSTVSHSIRGKIFMPSGGLPEHRIRVVLEVRTGGIASETFSDSVGNFEFRGLSNNTYQVVVPSDNQTYETANESVEAFGNFTRIFTVQIYLRDKDNDRNLTTKDKILSAADIQEVPKAAKKAYEQGLKLARDGKNEKAGEKFQEALQILPDYLHALNKLGEQMAILNKNDVAQSSFERAIAINSRFALPYINLGLLMINQKRFDEAVSTLETGISNDASYPMGHLNLGLALMSKTPPDLDRAEKEMSLAIELGKRDFFYVRKLLFNLNVRRQKYDKAAAQLEAYLKESPDAPDTQDVRLMLDKAKKAMAQQAAAQKQQ